MTAPSVLTPTQQATLDRLLRNESDVAYRRRVRRVVEYLDLSSGQTVFDCGTGMGFYLKVIAALYPGCRLFGIDYTPRVLRFARTHLPPTATVVRGDIHRLPFADGSMDRVIMSEVLEHLDDDARGLAEVHRVMRPGGILAITVPNARYPYWYDPINRVAEGVFRRPIRRGPFAGIWANHQRLYERDDLVALVAGAGFTVETVEELTHYCFPATQTIVYTVGKELVERDLLPGFISRSTHRFSGEDNSGSPWNPINWALAVLDWFDRLNLNEERLAKKETFVNVTLRARRL